MINKYVPRILVVLFFIISNSISAQDINDIGADKVTQLKKEGKLTGKEQYTNRLSSHKSPIVSAPSPNAQASALCNCWIPRDTSFHIVQFDGSGGSGGPGLPPQYRNDDWSTDLITLPFNICFYGTTVNQIFINNNGNISIGTPYSTFTANPFPDSTYVMIAPFWADVDTRGALSGLVYASITPTHLIVQWENVGYYGNHDDKLNTFQLIVTNGTDPIIPIGQNVSFCYKDMQWTTGDASSGVGGFGGSAATVGINKGANNDYIQFGQFDAAGANYDGPFGLNDGVDWLDNQSFTINACINTTNIPPVLNSLNVCDTIRLCENTTYQLTANYISPEQGETTHINFFPFGMTGCTVVSNTPGNTATLVLEITGQTSNLGYHTISVTAMDDGTPNAATNNFFVIEVLPAPLPSFTVAPSNSVSTNSPVTFTNTTPPGSLLMWDFGDGSPTTTLPSPVHSFTNPGSFTVTLSATFPNGCVTTVTEVINVCSATATFTVNNACVGAPTTITYTGVASALANFTWDFAGATVLSGSGRGPYNVSWNSSGLFPVTLTVVESVCSTTVVMPVNITAGPVTSITPLSAMCQGDTPTINFSGTAGPTATFTWNFGTATVLSGSGSGPYDLQFNTPGNDQITLLVSDNGCVDSTQIPVQVNAIPTSTFTILPTACAGDVLNIGYTGTAGPGANYIWDFNNGNVVSGSGQGPYSVSWNSGGHYTINLSVVDNGCYSLPSNMPIDVTDLPVVSISTMSALCVGQAGSITFTGTTGVTSIFNWNFGSATVISGSGAGPYSLQWNSPGADQVQLSVNENGCIGQTITPVTINAIPTSDFVVNNSACAGAPVSLNYIGTGTPNANYNWTFNNGTVLSGSGQGPYSITWNLQGAYQISLIVDENGCISSQTDLMATINGLPTVNAGNDSTVCSGNVVQLGRAAVPGELYQWSPTTNLSDPLRSDPSATPVNNTLATIQDSYLLTVTDGNGCVNVDTVLVGAYPVPLVNYSRPLDQCILNNNFLLDALSNIPTGVNFLWTFTPEASLANSTLSEVSVVYSTIGTYPVVLTADYNGCPSPVFIDSITIHEMPMPDFFPLVTQGCEPLTVPFTNISVGDGNTYNWDFGDGTNDDDDQPVHVYQHSGVFSVGLTATNRFGCEIDTNYKNIINVFAAPGGQFIPNPQTANILAPIIQFQNHSTNVLSYSWDFGDNDTAFSSLWSPSHTYGDTGSYLVTLYLESPHGCVDTVRGMVRVEDNFSFYVPNSFTPNGDGVNDNFKGYGVAIQDFEMNIYDRWGILIFSTKNYDQPWDGQIDKRQVVNDVYVYRIAIVDEHNQKHVFVGDVTVVR